MFYMTYYESQSPDIYDDGNIVYNPPIKHDFYIPGDSVLSLLSANLSLETNRGGSLTFTVPASHPFCEKPKLFADGFSVEFKNRFDPIENDYRSMIWYGRPISSSIGIDGSVEYTCEGVLNFFNDITIPDTGDSYETYPGPGYYMGELMSWVEAKGLNGVLLNGFGTDVEDTGQILISREKYGTILYELNNYFLKNYGGYLNVRPYEDTNTGRVSIDFWHSLTPYDVTDESDGFDYSMKVGKNIVDITVSFSTLDLVTDVSYTWYKENGDLGGVGSFDLLDSSTVDDIFKGIYVHRNLKVTDCKNDSEARQLIKQYCMSSLEDSIEATVTVVDPVFTVRDNIMEKPWYEISQLVRLYLPGEDSFGMKLLINKIEYDLLDPFKTTCTLGKSLPTLSDQATKNKISEKIQDETNIF